jgi:gliding motility-associated-like protein
MPNFSGCVPYIATFTNSSVGGTDFIWNFGDGGSSNLENPVHTFTNTGKYPVQLIAIDLNTCNQRDTVTDTVQVVARPIAVFDFTPVPANQNTPSQFINQSLNADSYIWNFGDGSTSALSNPSHQFNKTDTFSVCLQAINAAGCSDTLCKSVPALVLSLLDLPNAFTPGQNGINSVIKIQGFGITKLMWNIYNRWGQLVFQSTDTNMGWDGSFKGKQQPMDVYTYTLDAEFFDGKKVNKTGNITLIR